MQNVTVGDIREALNGQLLGDDSCLDTVIEQVDTDSRNIHPGSLFIPLVGENYDGHNFIRDALNAGAAGCLTAWEPDELLPGKFYIKVDDTERDLGNLAKWYKGRFDIPFIAVTGSVGKTTTRDMVAAVLSEKYRVHKNQGNFNNQIGLPLTLLDLDSSCQMCVLEIGMDHPGEIDYLSWIIQPDVAVITNIGVAHIENMGSIENILKAKCEIFNHTKPGAPAVLNGDDEMLLSVRDTISNPIVWCGCSSVCNYRAVDIESDGEKMIRCRVEGPDGTFPLEIPALGEHMVYPALIAAAVGAHFGLTEQEIAQGVLNFVPTKMRMNVLHREDDIVILDDTYNANPQSVRAAVLALADSSCRRRVAVLGDMLELGPLAPALHAGIGELAAESGIDCLICVGELSKHMTEAAENSGMSEVYWRQDKKEAEAVLEQVITPGTTVLVKASRGMAFEEIVGFLEELVPPRQN
ncbi:MAG: UDP-N-acetylmuramoyl-tripeptide--D-alanyl-D-alanine ligase [Oscillospiraceae bacterium]|nr:UDP-N-acetylmuramoyl-tripeptide--D-alanyl-D-alanine ligase [Oscillospiraceae bacterium]